MDEVLLVDGDAGANLRIDDGASILSATIIIIIIQSFSFTIGDHHAHNQLKVISCVSNFLLPL